ncbi:MAG: hypothetical protein GX633_01375 [Clostridiales bacterium]|nr:hypothetical protein [Clostridiales bacterium]
MRLPKDFVSMMRPLTGDELISELQHGEAKRGLRVNTLRITPEEFEKLSSFPLRKSPLCSEGFIIDRDAPAGTCAFHDAGLYYLQEPSASAVGEACGDVRGLNILDLCAAPGGKSTHLAAKAGHSGTIIANECVKSRTKPLRSNLERMGVRIHAVTSAMPYELKPYFAERFDLVLADVPCSGEGMFRREENALREWSLDHVRSCAERQSSILEDAAAMTAPGGLLVYSTCTLNVYENELTIDTFLSAHPEFVMERIDSVSIPGARPDWCKALNEYIRLAGRLMPHVVEGEGHFVAKMRKTTEGSVSSVVKSIIKSRLRAMTTQENELFYSFWRDSFSCEPWYEPAVFEDKVYLISPELRDIPYSVSQGVHAGSFRTKRFEPSHTLYMAVSPDDIYSTLPLDNETYRAFISGLELPCEEKGFCAVTFGGYIIGYGKGSGGVLKNKYPAGLRRY